MQEIDLRRRVKTILGMIWVAVAQTVDIDSAVPAGNHHFLASQFLEYPKRVQLQRSVKKDLKIVQNSDLPAAPFYNLSQQSSRVDRSLLCRQVKHVLGKLKIDVDAGNPFSLCYFVENGRFACTGGSHNQN